MRLKDKIKKEIDMIPEEYLPQVEQYIKAIKIKKDKRIKTLHLKGKYDKINARELAYK